MKHACLVSRVACLLDRRILVLRLFRRNSAAALRAGPPRLGFRVAPPHLPAELRHVSRDSGHGHRWQEGAIDRRTAGVFSRTRLCCPECATSAAPTPVSPPSPIFKSGSLPSSSPDVR